MNKFSLIDFLVIVTILFCAVGVGFTMFSKEQTENIVQEKTIDSSKPVTSTEAKVTPSGKVDYSYLFTYEIDLETFIQEYNYTVDSSLRITENNTEQHADGIKVYLTEYFTMDVLTYKDGDINEVIFWGPVLNTEDSYRVLSKLVKDVFIILEPDTNRSDLESFLKQLGIYYKYKKGNVKYYKDSEFYFESDINESIPTLRNVFISFYKT